MKRLALSIFCIIFLSACGTDEPVSYDLCNYGSMMVVNNKQYVRIPVKREFILKNQIGSIKEKIQDDYHPVKDFTSNILEKGTPLYSVKDYSQYVIAKTKDSRYLLFEEMK